MSQLPIRRDPDRQMVPAQLELSTSAGGGEEASLGELLGILRRNWWIILGCIALGGGAAKWMTERAVPVYQSSTSIRIGEKQSAISDMLLPLSGGGEVPTEMEVLASRTLAEDAVSALGLQLRVVQPRFSRARVIRDVRVAADAPRGEYTLRLGPDGRYSIRMTDSTAVLGTVAPGDTVRLPGVSFQLRPEAVEHPEIQLAVSGFMEAVGGVSGGVSVTRSGRDAKIVTLAFQSSDPGLAAEVPNLIAQRFVARRVDAQRAAAGSTIQFLRQQLDTLSTQLRSAEAALLAYRERERVVNPQVEGSTQVTRLVQLQSERSQLETERAALAKLLAETEAAAAIKRPDDPSPYRNLVSFPTLLRNQGAARLLDALVELESERSLLLARRTTQDPDVQIMTNRVKSIENELKSMAVTYLQGITHQVDGLDSTLRGFGRQLQQVPERELQYTRLLRQPQLLEELYALLQTRLKEAEITQAANDFSVQVVDPAIEPRRPIRPRPRLNLVLGVMLGAMVGTAASFMKEFLDKTVHTRADVLVATGLSVIGLIPRIHRSRSRFALIAEKRASRRQGEPKAVPKPAEPPRIYTPPTSNPVRYTFLMGDGSNETGTEDPAASVQQTPPPAPVAPVIPAAGVRRVEVSEAGEAALEAYGGLLTNLSYSLAEAPPRVVTFTSALPGEGKTTNAVNLALALAHRGSKVLLVDADLRRGLVHSAFEATREPGLTDVLWGKIAFEHAVRRVEVGEHASMDYLTTGSLPPNPTSLVESGAMRKLIDQWREEYDGVVIDTPPVNVITDAALLGAQADGVVLVARAGVTHGAALGFALEQLRRVQAQVLGVVLSDIDFARDMAYDPSYRYHRYDQYTTARS